MSSSRGGSGLAPMELEGETEDEEEFEERKHSGSGRKGRKRRSSELEEAEVEEYDEPRASQPAAAYGDEEGAYDDTAGGDGEAAAEGDDESIPGEAEEARDRRRAAEKQQKEDLKRRLQSLNAALAAPEMVRSMIRPDGGTFQGATHKLDELSREVGVRDIGNALLDAQGYDLLGSVGQRQAKTLTSGVALDVDDIMERFQARWGRGAGGAGEEDAAGAGEGGIRWEEFGLAICGLWRSVPATSFLKGVLGLNVAGAPKEKKARRRARKDEEEEDVAHSSATQLRDTSGEARSMTDRRVTNLYNHLPTAPMPFFHVLLHPTDFTQSVENVFDLTFLVKEGRAEVSIDPDMHIPVVRRLGEEDAPVGSEEGEEGAEATKSTFQCIVRLDHDTWQQLVSAFDIRRPFLPDRSEEYKAARAQEARAEKKRRAENAAASAAAANGVAPAVAAASAAASSHAVALANGSGTGSARKKPRAADRIPAHVTLSQPTMARFLRTEDTQEEEQGEEEEEEEEKKAPLQ